MRHQEGRGRSFRLVPATSCIRQNRVPDHQMTLSTRNVWLAKRWISDQSACCSGRGRVSGRGRGGGHRQFNAHDGHDSQPDAHLSQVAPAGSDSSEHVDPRGQKHRQAAQSSEPSSGFDTSEAKAMMKSRWEAVQHTPGAMRHTKAAPVKTAWGNGSASSLLRKFDFAVEAIEKAKTAST